jgi:hypothetical protein
MLADCRTSKRRFHDKIDVAFDSPAPCPDSNSDTVPLSTSGCPRVAAKGSKTTSWFAWNLLLLTPKPTSSLDQRPGATFSSSDIASLKSSMAGAVYVLKVETAGRKGTAAQYVDASVSPRRPSRRSTPRRSRCRFTLRRTATCRLAADTSDFNPTEPRQTSTSGHLVLGTRAA